MLLRMQCVVQPEHVQYVSVSYLLVAVQAYGCILALAIRLCAEIETCEHPERNQPYHSKHPHHISRQ